MIQQKRILGGDESLLSCQRTRLALCLLLGLLLSGCGRITGHVIINRDGSAELQISSGLATTPASVMSNEVVLDMFRGYLSEYGFTLEERETNEGTELVARKHLDRANELLSLAAPASTRVPAICSLRLVRGMLSDSYYCQLDLDLATWLSSLVTEWQYHLAKLVLSGQELTLQVTLPWAAKEHNADFTTDNGRTLGWNLSFDRPRQLELLLLVPSRNLFLIVAGVLVTSLCCALAWLHRRKRK